MATTLPFQSGMKLGRTFDGHKLQIGTDVFTDSASKTTMKNQASIQYAVIESCQDINKFLGMDRAVSLKIKAGVLQVQGIEKYLTDRDYRPERNTVEILIRSRYERAEVALKESDLKVKPREEVIGSHYIRSITYGGDMLVRIRISGSNSGEIEHIRRELDSSLKLDGSLDDNARSYLQRIGKRLDAKFEITCYAAPLQGTIPQSIDGVLFALDSFRERISKATVGKVVPLTCQLQPLSYLVPEMGDVPTENLLGLEETNQAKGLEQQQEHHSEVMDTRTESESIEVQLEMLENNYDDVLLATAKLKTFVKREDVTFNDWQEKKALKLENKLDKVITVFNKVIAQHDILSGEEASSGLKPALKVYKKNMAQGRYMTEVEELIGSICPQLTVTRPQKELPPGNQLNLVLIGKTGHGKSATGNTIFEEIVFKSEPSVAPVTQECQLKIKRVGGRDVHLVDTPGSMTAYCSTDPISNLGTAVSLMEDGCTAFILVIHLNARYTEEERDVINMIVDEDVLKKYTVLVFTYGNDLYSQQRREEKMLFRDFIKSNHEEFVKLLEECQQRYVFIDNMEEDPVKRREQVIELVKVIDGMQFHNKYEKYTQEMFQKAVENANEGGIWYRVWRYCRSCTIL